MYLEFYKLDRIPFSLTPDTDFYCDLPGHEQALQVVLFCLHSGDGFVKIIGEVGVGKTLLCRKILNTLDSDYVSCYIPNPDLRPDGLRKALAIELGITIDESMNPHSLLGLINETLLAHHAANRRVVLLVDEAQALSDESLETLRLFTNFETEKKKLLQVVLLAQPELDERLQQSKLRQVRQRITFSHYIEPLTLEQSGVYMVRRLVAAGHQHGMIFNEKARKLLCKSSGGLPRVLNILCHKALLAAFSRQEQIITIESVKHAIADSRDVLSGRAALPKFNTLITKKCIGIAALTIALLGLLGLIYDFIK